MKPGFEREMQKSAAKSQKAAMASGVPPRAPRLRLIPVALVICALAIPVRFAGALTKPEEGAANNGWLRDLTAQLRGAIETETEAPAEPQKCTVDDGVPAVARLTEEARKHFSARQAALDAREQALQGLSGDIAAEIARLEGLQDDIGQQMKRQKSLAQKDVNKLVTVYGAMKPDDAARLLNETDTAVVFQILDTMDGRISAPILAEMTSSKVNALTEQYALRNVMPGDRPVTVAFEN